MLRPRIIPSLLIHNKGLVKTVKFKEGKYVGDPINAVRIFNEKSVDEIAIFDIDATRENRAPDFKLIESLANECRMPFCYGGGIRTVEQAQTIFSLGVEKIALSSAIIEQPQLIADIAQRVGAQSVVAVLDVKKKIFGGYEVYTHNGTKGTGKKPAELATLFQQLGAGEIVVNAIDQDGVMKGFDFDLCDQIVQTTQLPVTILGGAGSLEDIGKAIQRYGIIGVAAGSLFVFKGVYKAVLINYPEDKNNLLLQYFQS